jgi:hypothetical protein
MSYSLAFTERGGPVKGQRENMFVRQIKKEQNYLLLKREKHKPSEVNDIIEEPIYNLV